MAEKTEPKVPEDPFEVGRDRLRETIKWLVASFGAVAASLALGSQLGNLGELEGWRLSVALASAGVAFAGVIGALAMAVAVQVGSYVSFGQLGAAGSDDELVRFIEQENPQYLGNYETLTALREAYLKAFRDGSDQRVLLAARVATLLNVASYERLRRNFHNRLKWIISSVAIAAVAVIAFAWAATGDATKPETSVTPAIVAQPSTANLSLLPTAAALLRDELGPACKTDQLPAIALGSTEGKLDVLVLPTRACNATRLSVGSETGVVTAAERVCEVGARRPDDEFVDCGGVSP